jgi:hypothetical protein
MFLPGSPSANNYHEPREMADQALRSLPCAFLMLPAEVSLRIYRLVFNDCKIYVYGEGLKSLRQIPLFLSETRHELLLTCKSIYNEGFAAWCSSTFWLLKGNTVSLFFKHSTCQQYLPFIKSRELYGESCLNL